ncbi:uncharacterized protein [Ptychodera flava]|uniref:uncharacterized protein isoform X2 n=1 Tax=Ptychodera flava TaxID=63121 RepID=UPI00396A163E
MGSSPSKKGDRKSIISSESENKDNKQHYLPDFVFAMLKDCLYSLPLPPGRGVNDKTCERIARHVKKVDIMEPQDILQKGEAAKGIYIVVSGEAEVVSEKGTDVIATISRGDYFGEISVLFDKPCTARVRVPNKAILLLLKKDEAKRILHRVEIEMKDYYVLKRYLDTDGSVDQNVLHKEITLNAFKQVPLFEHWTPESLEFMLSRLQSVQQPIVVYPAESCLLIQNDPSQEICILLRGKLEVLDGRRQIITIEAKKVPVCLGEEGMFTGKERVTSFRALTACHVISLEKSFIHETIQEFEQDAGVYYSRSSDYWMQIGKWKSRRVYQKYEAELQIEVVMQKLWNTLIFSEVPVGFIYMIAMTATAYEHNKNEIVLTETDYRNQQLFLLVEGAVQFISQAKPVLDLKPGDVFWNSSWLPASGHIKASSSSLLVRFTAKAVQDALKAYPDAVLILPQKPSQLINGETAEDTQSVKQGTGDDDAGNSTKQTAEGDKETTVDTEDNNNNDDKTVDA